MSGTFQNQDTIVALATAQGVGAISIVRLSGNDCIDIVNTVFKGADLAKKESHTIHFGTIRDEDIIVDEVLVSLFIAPKSFTKENSVEISCHGSMYVVKQIIKVLLKHGARLALPGEFTKRAFLNGQFDLAQAEAVADLIHSDTAASHQAALTQMRGGFSNEIKALRTELIHFASMIELELDFGEEDVEFANRDDLKELVNKLQAVLQHLISSFDVGNAIKNGVPTVIAGKPNAGKSTLLNALLNEDRAIVSEIAGTTRDSIEDEIVIGGINFRFIDTAGLRETDDTIEAMGVARTRKKMEEASLILYMFDLAAEPIDSILNEIALLEKQGIPFIAVGNKIDKATIKIKNSITSNDHVILISASSKENLKDLEKRILHLVNLDTFKTGDTLVQTQNSLNNVLSGLGKNVTGDFLAMDIRQALHYLGEITGEITTDDLLENIFSKFCIGK